MPPKKKTAAVAGPSGPYAALPKQQRDYIKDIISFLRGLREQLPGWANAYFDGDQLLAALEPHMHTPNYRWYVPCPHGQTTTLTWSEIADICRGGDADGYLTDNVLNAMVNIAEAQLVPFGEHTHILSALISRMVMVPRVPGAERADVEYQMAQLGRAFYQQSLVEHNRVNDAPERVLFYLNLRQNHWTLADLNIAQRTLTISDSFGSNRRSEYALGIKVGQLILGPNSPPPGLLINSASAKAPIIPGQADGASCGCYSTAYLWHSLDPVRFPIRQWIGLNVDDALRCWMLSEILRAAAPAAQNRPAGAVLGAKRAASRSPTPPRSRSLTPPAGPAPPAPSAPPVETVTHQLAQSLSLSREKTDMDAHMEEWFVTFATARILANDEGVEVHAKLALIDGCEQIARMAQTVYRRLNRYHVQDTDPTVLPYMYWKNQVRTVGDRFAQAALIYATTNKVWAPITKVVEEVQRELLVVTEELDDAKRNMTSVNLRMLVSRTNKEAMHTIRLYGQT